MDGLSSGIFGGFKEASFMEAPYKPPHQDLMLKAGLQCNMEPEACYCRDQQLSSSAHFAWCARMVFEPNEATNFAVLF
ncbi:hypothetical protein GOBAR_DD28879 [Gossypium barbadense]|nr:hypothetical protein GOBAR_DD28879 [Gossypium barbadense]